MMKAKAEAEAKEMQAEGMKRGEDFLDCKCYPHNPPAIASTALHLARWIQGS